MQFLVQPKSSDQQSRKRREGGSTSGSQSPGEEKEWVLQSTAKKPPVRVA